MSERQYYDAGVRVVEQEAKIARLRVEVEELRGVLRRLEWSGKYSYCTGWPCCPVCKGISPEMKGLVDVDKGHRPNCALAAALKGETP